MPNLQETIAQIEPPDENAGARMRDRLDHLTKPAGSLGRLEDLAVQLAAIRRTPRPSVDRKVIVVAAADHGVVEEGVSAYPGDVTRQMLAVFVAGRAAINVLARQAGAEVIVVDAGVKTDDPLPDPVVALRIGPGTGNLRRER